MKWNKDSIEWAIRAMARHNDLPDYFLDNLADRFIKAYEYHEKIKSSTIGLYKEDPHISTLRTEERRGLKLDNVYPNIEALKIAFEEFSEQASVMEEQIRIFAKSQEEKRNRQASFGKLNKKDPRANRRNYLKGKR